MIVLTIVMICLSGLLFLPLSANIFFKNRKLCVKAGVFFIKFTVLPAKEKKPKKKKKTKINLQKKSLREKVGTFFKSVPKMVEGARLGLSVLGGVARHLRVKKLRTNVEVGGEDAATVGIRYGQICALVYPLLGLLDSKVNINWRKTSINISPDFENNDSVVELEAKVRIFLVFALAALLGAALNKTKEKAKNTQNFKTRSN